jgi:hypothetical protein
MEIQKSAAAYDIYVQTRAEITGKSEAEIKAEIKPEEFEKRVRDLYHQWICGEFSYGRFTELIGVPHWELWEIFDALGLPRHK